MARAHSLGPTGWTRITHAGGGAEHLRTSAGWLAGLAALVLLAVASRGSLWFKVLIGEDGVYEWVQVICWGATAVLAARASRRSADRRRRVALTAVALAAAVVVGEGLAWGTRLFDVQVEGVQAVNRQNEVTLDNLGFGLEASFLAMAAR